MSENQAPEIRDAINERFRQAVHYLLETKRARNKNEIMNSLGLYLGRLTLLLNGTANASIDNLANLSKMYGVSADWLLLGRGDLMSGTAASGVAALPPTAVLGPASSTGIPLIPIAALAGFNGVDEPGVRLDDCLKYDVPDFATAGADFLIRVQGNSMVPTFMSGDLVACKKVRTDSWMDYGSAYVVDGEQGIMLKRIYNHPNDETLLMCKSDNPEVAPFSIRKSEVRSLSKVIGIIRNE